EILYDLEQNTTYYWSIDAFDNHGGSNQSPEWTFLTEAPNNPPVALDQAVSTFIDAAVNITLTATDEDPQQLQYEIVTQPYNGVLSGTPPDMTYTPSAGVEGRDSFTFRADDGEYYSNVAEVSTFMWIQPERLDSADGTDITLSYSPTGTLRAFYNVLDPQTPSSNYMVSRKRISPNGQFGSEILVYADAGKAAIHYDATGNLDLAVDRGYDVVVLESDNGGDSWVAQQDYLGSHPQASAAVTRLSFTEDGNKLRLFYSYMDRDYWGNLQRTRYTEKIDGDWDTNIHGTPFSDGFPVAAHENGDKVSVFIGSGIHHSIDNGVVYTFNSGGNPYSAYGLGASDFALGPQGELTLIRSYSAGPLPDNKHLMFRISLDDGTTWEEPQLIIQNHDDYFTSLRFAIDGDNIVACWVESDIPNEPRELKCVVSQDAGASWSPEYVVKTLTAPEIFWVYFPAFGYDDGRLDVEAYNGKFSVAYSIVDKTGPSYDRNRVEIMELNLGNQAPLPPNAPSNLNATAVSSSQIDLTWDDNSNNEDGFKIERKIVGGVYSQIATVGANIENYPNTNLDPDTTYYYRVLAYNSVGDSGYSNEASATTNDTAPLAPSSLNATAVSSSQIDLTWDDNSGNESGFKIERKDKSSGDMFIEIDTVGPDIAQYSDVRLARKTRYRYRVRAYNAGGDSGYSNADGARTFGIDHATPVRKL
ncbi:fibronectin type III domain-containing protein, partial [Thermoproteota archaeon]